VLLIFVLISLHRRRKTLIVSLRGVPTLSFSLICGYIFTVIVVVSILIGKSVMCELLGFVHALYVPFCCSHLVFLHPVVLTAHRKNQAVKQPKGDGGDYANNATSGVGGRTLQKYFTDKMQFVYIFLTGTVSVVVYCGIHWGLEVKVPGECNRDSLLVGTSVLLLLFFLVSVFVLQLHGVPDPVFYRVQTNLGMIIVIGPVLLTLMYSLGPHLFPPWFDYRWNLVIGDVILMFDTGYMPVLLSIERVQRFLTPARKLRTVASTEMTGIQANQAMLTMHTGKEFFRSCLETPVLLKSFTQFMRLIWCVENIMFYCEVNEYRRLLKSSPEQAKTCGLTIIQECVAPGSLLEINVDHPTRRELMELVHTGVFTETTFDRAQSEIYSLMLTDSFEKWVHTESFSEALEEAVKDLQLSSSS